MEITSLFQFNFLLHMCIPYPDNSGVYPYFQKENFRIRKIEEPIPLNPINSKILLDQKNINRKNVTPEMILTNKNELLLIECKIGPLDYDYSKHGASQAAGYFSLEASDLKKHLGYSENECIVPSVAYGISLCDINTIKNTLITIKSDINKIVHKTLPHKIFEISEEPDGIYLITDSKKINVIKKEHFSHSASFYLVPIEMNGKIDDHGSETLKYQVKNKLRQLIGMQLNNKNIIVNSLDIAKSVNPFWDMLPKKLQDKIKLWISKNIKNHLDDFHTISKTATFSAHKLTISNLSENQKRKLRKYLLSSDFFENQVENFNSFQLSLPL